MMPHLGGHGLRVLAGVATISMPFAVHGTAPAVTPARKVPSCCALPVICPMGPSNALYDQQPNSHNRDDHNKGDDHHDRPQKDR